LPPPLMIDDRRLALSIKENRPLYSCPLYSSKENRPLYSSLFLSPLFLFDKLVSLVDRMLELHKKKNSLPPSAEREKIERKIAVTDEKIDDIVYGLYGVTEKERKVIEER